MNIQASFVFLLCNCSWNVGEEKAEVDGNLSFNFICHSPLTNIPWLSLQEDNKEVMKPSRPEDMDVGKNVERFLLLSIKD